MNDVIVVGAGLPEILRARLSAYYTLVDGGLDFAETMRRQDPFYAMVDVMNARYARERIRSSILPDGLMAGLTKYQESIFWRTAFKQKRRPVHRVQPSKVAYRRMQRELPYKMKSRRLLD